MATAVDIANFALGHLAETSITSLTQPVERARVMNRWLDQARRRALREANWTCASKLASIAEDATAPVYGYTHRYLKPADFIRLIAVKDSGSGVNFDIEGRYILTNKTSPIYIKYVHDLEDVSQFDPDLVDVMALILAFYASPKLTHNRTKRKDLEEEAIRVAAAAKNVDSSGNSPIGLQAGSWLAAREGGRDPSKWW